ncbi:MAG: hypothetical protein ACOCXP_01740, partial [Candidatus Dojkabacteria bacterium]
HIVGVKSLGIYAPIVLTFSLYALGLREEGQMLPNIWDGVRYGLAFLITVVATTVLGTLLTRGSRMHYFPKISINLSLVAAALLGVLVLGDIFGRNGFTSTNALALVMLVSVAEQFTAILFKKKLRVALIMTLETVGLAFFCFLLISWHDFQNILLKYPYLVLLVLLINYVVGKYRGLRFREFVRFRQVLNKERDEN